MNVPSHTNSAMDGFALRGSDLPGDGTAELVLAGEALAGHPFGAEVAAKIHLCWWRPRPPAVCENGRDVRNFLGESLPVGTTGCCGSM